MTLDHSLPVIVVRCLPQLSPKMCFLCLYLLDVLLGRVDCIVNSHVPCAKSYTCVRRSMTCYFRRPCFTFKTPKKLQPIDVLFLPQQHTVEAQANLPILRQVSLPRQYGSYAFSAPASASSEPLIAHAAHLTCKMRWTTVRFSPIDQISKSGWTLLFELCLQPLVHDCVASCCATNSALSALLYSSFAGHDNLHQA
jgi:hypothetical protein